MCLSPSDAAPADGAPADSAHADAAHAVRGKLWPCDERDKIDAGECQKFTPILRENTELWDESK